LHAYDAACFDDIVQTIALMIIVIVIVLLLLLMMMTMMMMMVVVVMLTQTRCEAVNEFEISIQQTQRYGLIQFRCKCRT
jgi:hypothetical protein